MRWNVAEMLRKVVESGASDLHLAVDYPPMVRINGELQPSGGEALNPDDTKDILNAVTTEEARQTFFRNRELDFSFSLPELGRFRINASFQRETIALSFRPVPVTVRKLEELGLPEVCKKLVTRPRGLVLVSGPAGSGKSTTLAAMIDYLNERSKQRIITIEDPIEFIHHSKKSMIVQREVGVDTLSFSNGLRHILRQDPNVILIGELRDLDTISIALMAAETGHLVLSTVHTNGAIESVERIVGVFPAETQQQIRFQLSVVLEGVIFQQLLPRANRQGRVLAVEVLVGTLAVRNLIRQNELHQVRTYLHSGSEYGMQTLEQSLSKLVRGKEITVAEARSRAADLKSLEGLLLPLE